MFRSIEFTLLFLTAWNHVGRLKAAQVPPGGETQYRSPSVNSEIVLFIAFEAPKLWEELFTNFRVNQRTLQHVMHRPNTLILAMLAGLYCNMSDELRERSCTPTSFFLVPFC